MPENPAEKLLARLNAQKAAIDRQNQALRDQTERRINSLPRRLGSQNDLSDPKDIGMIVQWDVGNGTIVYTRQSMRDRSGFFDQVPALAARIEQQKGQFDGLAPEEQGRLRGEFTTSPTSEAVTPYSDLLRSEALGQKFQQLQQARSHR